MIKQHLRKAAKFQTQIALLRFCDQTKREVVHLPFFRPPKLVFNANYVLLYR
jgi:hypothetical protein